MSDDSLYPDPPHLSIAIWSPEDEESVFGRACDVASELGCVPAGTVEFAPRGEKFALLQDLEQRTRQTLPTDVFDRLVHGRDETRRPLRAAYRAGKQQKVVVEHLFGTADEQHPTAVSLSAGPLGVPDSLWRARDRKAADRLADWAVEVLRALTARCGATYGAIGVEETLPTPSALRAGVPVGAQPFLSSELPVSVRAAFETAFATAGVSWPKGTFFPGGSPGPNPEGLAKASRLLGQALP